MGSKPVICTVGIALAAFERRLSGTDDMLSLIRWMSANLGSFIMTPRSKFSLSLLLSSLLKSYFIFDESGCREENFYTAQCFLKKDVTIFFFFLGFLYEALQLRNDPESNPKGNESPLQQYKRDNRIPL